MMKIEPLPASISAVVTVALSTLMASPVPSSWTSVVAAVCDAALGALDLARVHVGDDHVIQQHLTQLIDVGRVHQAGAVRLRQGREGRVGRGEDRDRRLGAERFGQLGGVERAPTGS